MNRPDLKGVLESVVVYIEFLEERLTEYEDNGLVDMYKALSDKVKDIASAIRDAQVKFDGDDKSFDRMMKMLEKNRVFVENLLFLEQKLGINQQETDSEKQATKNKFKSPIEHLSKENAKKGQQGDD